MCWQTSETRLGLGESIGSDGGGKGDHWGKLCDDLTWSFGHVPINDEEGKYHIAHCKLRWNLARLNWRRH